MKHGATRGEARHHVESAEKACVVDVKRNAADRDIGGTEAGRQVDPTVSNRARAGSETDAAQTVRVDREQNRRSRRVRIR
jgi:hypothetical protein